MGSPRGAGEEDLTAKRDLKRHVRERQARTGERYRTALEQVLADRRSPIPVIEAIDLTPIAAPIGFACRTVAFSDLASRVDLPAALRRLRHLLVAAGDDPGLRLFRQVALEGKVPRVPIGSVWADQPRFLERAQAGLGGVNASGTTLAVPVLGPAGIENVVCTLWGLHLDDGAPELLPHIPPKLVLRSVQELFVADLGALGQRLAGPGGRWP
jgi:hypothetical protein